MGNVTFCSLHCTANELDRNIKETLTTAAGYRNKKLLNFCFSF